MKALKNGCSDRIPRKQPFFWNFWIVRYLTFILIKGSCKKP